MNTHIKALLVAATLTALTTNSMALNNSATTSTPVPVAPAGAGGSNLGSAQLFAVVNANGTVARGKGEIASAKLGVGHYRVGFSRDIVSCGYVAGVGAVGTEIVTGIANVSRTGNAFVIVRTFTLTGTQADRPFHLYIDC